MLILVRELVKALEVNPFDGAGKELEVFGREDDV